MMKNKAKWRETESRVALSIESDISFLLLKLQRVREKDYGVHKFVIG
jgi:hypothetical protein